MTLNQETMRAVRLLRWRRETAGTVAVSNARVVAVDIRESARRLARQAGAHAAVSGVAGPGRLREEAGGRGAALVLDCVATDDTLALAAGVTAPGGAISYVGRGGGSLPASPASLPFGCTAAPWSRQVLVPHPTCYQPAARHAVKIIRDGRLNKPDPGIIC